MNVGGTTSAQPATSSTLRLCPKCRAAYAIAKLCHYCQWSLGWKRAPAQKYDEGEASTS